jgi:hypothetical protein
MEEPFEELAWSNGKKYLLAALTVAGMGAGLQQLISELAYPLTGLVIKAINFILRTGFRDHLLVREPYGPRWSYLITEMAASLIILVVGMLLGLWANLRAHRQKSS